MSGMHTITITIWTEALWFLLGAAAGILSTIVGFAPLVQPRSTEPMPPPPPPPYRSGNQ